MERETIFLKYRNRLIKSYLFITGIMAMLELLLYFCMAKDNLKSRFYDYYFIFYMALPLFISISAIICAYKINKSERFKSTTKNFAVIFTLSVIALTACCIHNYFSIVFCSLWLPILICPIFGDKKLLNKTFIISVIFLIISSAQGALWEIHDNDLYGYNVFIALLFIVISYSIVQVHMDFELENHKEIEERIQEQRRLERQLKTDPMTTLFNNATFNDQLMKSIKTAEQRDIPFCLAVIDIDNFKSINDTYGHENGNEVLITLANIMKKRCESIDKICRYGGEEFAIIFNIRTIDEAYEIVDNILKDFRKAKYKFIDKPVTFSCGLCQYHDKMKASEIFNIADKAMYSAKSAGKNRIVVSK